jgi:enoyl-CoA hydratase
MEIALTGQPVDADEACQLGLLNRVVDDGDALAAAIEMAQIIGRNAPLAVTASRRLLAEAGGEPVSETGEPAADLIRRVAASADAHEGAVAFAERRIPVWRRQ